MQDFTTGFFPGEPAEVYHRKELGVVSNSVLKILRDRSPMHYRAYVDDLLPDTDSPAKRFGRLYHMAILEPERFAKEAIVMPDFGPMQSSTNRARRDEWRAALGSAEEITEEELARIKAMRAALIAHPVAAGIIKHGEAEVSMRWIDERTGLKCKARADWWRQGKFFMDLKTCQDASPAAFAKAIHNFRYHVQHAHYCDGARALGEHIDNYLILAQESEFPHACAVYHVDAATEVRGFELRERGMDLMLTCLETNCWPAYGDGISEISIPHYALKD